MKFGVCGNPDMARVAAKAGYDFMEWTVSDVLKPREPVAVFQSVHGLIQSAALPYPVLNCFVPGDLKLTGPEVDRRALQDFVTTVFERAGTVGVEVIVFGSGGARRIPDGFDRRLAQDQLIWFGSMLAPLAQDHGVTVVLEPLNRGECNTLNTCAECAELVGEVAHPAFRLLVDAYHMMKDGDPVSDITRHAGLLRHTHIATTTHRLPPGVEPCDFAPFFVALKTGGYDGRVSIEAKVTDPGLELPAALAAMRSLS